MDRLQMPSAMPAELAERLSDQPVDVTDATEDEAITAIIEDHLLDGDMYPKNGRRALSAGDIIAECSDDDDKRFFFDALIYDGRDGERLENAQRKAKEIVKEEGPKYLREHRHDLIETMLEEMAGEET